ALAPAPNAHAARSAVPVAIAILDLFYVDGFHWAEAHVLINFSQLVCIHVMQMHHNESLDVDHLGDLLRFLKQTKPEAPALRRDEPEGFLHDQFAIVDVLIDQ
ncbi:MAG: hypothetical protein ACK55Z_23660, partial [bacterium]